MARGRWFSDRRKLQASWLLLAIVGFIFLLLIFAKCSSSNGQAASSGDDVGASADPVMSGSAVPTSGSSAGAVRLHSDGRAVCEDIPLSGDKAFSAEVPADIRWDYASAGLKYPLSSSVGPVYRPGYVGQCFAHSPSGAAMSAVNYVGASSELETSEEDRRVLLSKRMEGKPEPLPLSHEGAQQAKEQGFTMLVVGYSVEEYSVSEAKVKVYLVAQQGNKKALRSMVLPVVWEEGDWKIFVPEGQDIGYQDSTDTVPMNFLSVNRG